jgi:Fe2+ or Zn2+ uptake regulation protein
MTRQRQLIYAIVTEKPVHLTAEEIFEKARERMPGIAMGTVYRNLGILVQEGKIRKLEIPSSPARYDRQSLSHPHLICERCGTVEDLDWGSDFLRQLSERCGRTLTGYDLKLYHVCDACKDKSF